MFNGKSEKEETKAIKEIKDIAHFDIEPCQLSNQFNDNTRYKRLDLTSGQKAQMNHLIQCFAQGTAANTLAKAYVLKFPEGLPHTLMKLNNGGFSSKIVDAKNTILGDASLYIKNVENSLIAYTNRVERCIISTFSAIQAKIKTLNKPNIFGKTEDQGKEFLVKVDELLKNYKNEEDSHIRISFQKMIACLKQTEFFYDCNGQIYVKAAQGEGTL